MDYITFPTVPGESAHSKPDDAASRVAKEIRRCSCQCHSTWKRGYHCHDCYKRHRTCGICTQPDPGIPYQSETLTRHHLIPKSVQDDNDSNKSVHLCRRCHDLVHDHWNNWQLKQRYDTLKKILSCATFRAFLRNHGVKWQHQI